VIVADASKAHLRGASVRVMGAVDDYIATLDTSARAAFERIQSLVMEVAPDADQGKSYGMAALKHQGRPLLGFRAAERHLSIFPFSPEVVEAVRDGLGDFDLSKGTIRFTAEKPLPDDVVREIARLRVAEIEGS
jgi:uncharacterized protein YdhG (YjbR/CyaY superfamily)